MFCYSNGGLESRFLLGQSVDGTGGVNQRFHCVLGGGGSEPLLAPCQQQDAGCCVADPGYGQLVELLLLMLLPPPPLLLTMEHLGVLG